MKPLPLVDLEAQQRALLPELGAAAARVLASGRFVLGPEVAAFELEAAAALGAAHAVGVSSGSDALVCALLALGVEPGDEVLTTPFTFFATAESIFRVGAVPRFADVDPDTLCLDPEAASARVTSRTRALLPVHLYGNPARPARFAALAAERDLALVEDAAQAFGAALEPEPAAACGARAARAYSFFPTKPLGACGDGGLVTTPNPAVAAACRAIRVHGASERHHHARLGGNYRLDELQAALLRVKLPHVATWHAARRALVAAYRAELAAVEQVTLVPHGAGSACSVLTVRVPAPDRDRIAAHLAEHHIATAVYYPVPLHLQPAVRERVAPVSLPHAERAATEVLSLPLHAALTPADIDRVVTTLRRYFAR